MKKKGSSAGFKKIETETDGKLTPAEAEAITSSDLPSGDPELSPPAASGDASPDFIRDKEAKAS